MSVEIRELIIRAVASDRPDSEERHEDARPPAIEEDSIVEACVRQVLKILRKSEER